MTNNSGINTNTRRRLFAGVAAGAAAVLVAPIAAKAAPSDDRELVSLSARYVELEHRKMSYFMNGSDPIIDDHNRERAFQPIYAEQKILIDRMANLEATTLAGIRARLDVVIADDLDGTVSDQCSMLAALLADMQGLADRGVLA